MKLTAETLAHAISNFIESYESTDALTILRDEFRLTDDEIREMGLDYLFDLAEPDEPDEPLTEYTFRYTETWTGLFIVEAHDRKEANDLFEKMLDSDSLDMGNLGKSDSDWYLID